MDAVGVVAAILGTVVAIANEIMEMAVGVVLGTVAGRGTEVAGLTWMVVTPDGDVGAAVGMEVGAVVGGVTMSGVIGRVDMEVGMVGTGVGAVGAGVSARPSIVSGADEGVALGVRDLWCSAPTLGVCDLWCFVGGATLGRECWRM